MPESRRLHFTVALYFAVFHGVVFVFIMASKISPYIPLMILDAPIMVAWSILDYFNFVEPHHLSLKLILPFGTILHYHVGYLIGGEIAQKKKLDFESLKRLIIVLVLLVPILVTGLMMV